MSPQAALTLNTVTPLVVIAWVSLLVCSAGIEGPRWEVGHGYGVGRAPQGLPEGARR